MPRPVSRIKRRAIGDGQIDPYTESNASPADSLHALGKRDRFPVSEFFFTRAAHIFCTRFLTQRFRPKFPSCSASH